MSLDKLIVSILSIIGIIFTYWFFLAKKELTVKTHGQIMILVEGGYSPAVIEIPVNRLAKITFVRKDSSSCLEEVVIGDFKIRQYLPLNQAVSMEITPEKVGEYQFECGMNMFHGKIKVV